MHLRLTFLISTFVLQGLAVPTSQLSHVVHEKRALEPVDWHQSHRANADQVLSLRIGLKQQNLEKLEDMLWSVSHPSSEKYGQHWTQQQVADTFAPSSETVQGVLEWLTRSGFAADRVKLSGSKSWLMVKNAKVSEVEGLLKTVYHTYTHSTTGEKQIGCKEYSVPSDIQDHIDIIRPTVHFNHNPSPREPPVSNFKRSGANLGSPLSSKFRGPKQAAIPDLVSPSLDTCDQLTTLDCLRALYSIDYTPVATDKNTYGIVEFTPQAYLADDLDLFFANFSPTQVGDRPILVSIDGGVAQTDNQGSEFNAESDLDLQYSMGLVNPQPISLLQTGDILQGAVCFFYYTSSTILDPEIMKAADLTIGLTQSTAHFLRQLKPPIGGDDLSQDGLYPDPLPGGYKGKSCGIIAPPHVVSVSYSQNENTITPRSAMRQCTEYGKLGLMGTTVFYSSGDNGVAGNNDVCMDPNFTFNPEFPSTCPFVSSVGATQMDPGATVNDPESACMQVIVSGGGFSNMFPSEVIDRVPDYQANAVAGYMRNAELPFANSVFNSTGKSRGYPDLAASGANYIIAVNGQFSRVFGTSASAPVVGSIFTMINDARIAAGKSTVGFINPVIYSDTFAAAFNDITKGSNPGCGTTGFPATPGWDPVTGVGTPNLSKLMPLFLALP
ncbi:hypothetical protein V5O48_004825 [Marasmius crinis-equi]|uniref:Peptidase S53 domain-containing protein n=1 Tax=Marasmius crinis-equi TaxID=585013 RepID=A0ABR3FP34_9AGAR